MPNDKPKKPYAKSLGETVGRVAKKAPAVTTIGGAAKATAKYGPEVKRFIGDFAGGVFGNRETERSIAAAEQRATKDAEASRLRRQQNANVANQQAARDRISNAQQTYNASTGQSVDPVTGRPLGAPTANEIMQDMGGGMIDPARLQAETQRFADIRGRTLRDGRVMSAGVNVPMNLTYDQGGRPEGLAMAGSPAASVFGFNQTVEDPAMQRRYTALRNEQPMNEYVGGQPTGNQIYQSDINDLRRGGSETAQLGNSNIRARMRAGEGNNFITNNIPNETPEQRERRDRDAAVVQQRFREALAASQDKTNSIRNMQNPRLPQKSTNNWNTLLETQENQRIAALEAEGKLATANATLATKQADSDLKWRKQLHSEWKDETQLIQDNVKAALGVDADPEAGYEQRAIAAKVGWDNLINDVAGGNLNLANQNRGAKRVRSTAFTALKDAFNTNRGLWESLFEERFKGKDFEDVTPEQLETVFLDREWQDEVQLYDPKTGEFMGDVSMADIEKTQPGIMSIVERILQDNRTKPTTVRGK